MIAPSAEGELLEQARVSPGARRITNCPEKGSG